MADTRVTQKPEWLNKIQLTQSLGISGTAFDKWKIEPIARIGRENFYSVRQVLDNRLLHQRHQIESANSQGSSVNESDLDFERLRLTRAQADNMEIKNEIARGQSAPIELITLVLSKVSGEAAGEIDSIPLNVRRKHPALNAQVIEDIKRHCVKAQNAVSRVDEILESALNDYLDKLNQN
jgi:phage terminase Nu1 subunit (DNA packaging protein)